MSLPPLLDPEWLADHLDAPDTLIIDVGRASTYTQLHVPGALHLEYTNLVSGEQPAVGERPDRLRLSLALCGLGLTPDTNVIAYDDEGGANAARLLWLLDNIGHPGSLSLLDGGLHAWANDDFPLETQPRVGQPTRCDIVYTERGYADLAYVSAHLDDPDVALLDARSEAEFHGTTRYSARGGHIPGAVHYEWSQALDGDRNVRTRDLDTLRAELAALGITPDKEIITYCQTHHRSSHSYWLLRALGFRRVRGYAGSWAEWGNRDDCPIA
ncbi:MAG: sulfurtransferase [Gammaproteobacteria bacterium]|nr:sulfurtransferase [Gammaproteobacteria bacterium]